MVSIKANYENKERFGNEEMSFICMKRYTNTLLPTANCGLRKDDGEAVDTLAPRRLLSTPVAAEDAVC